MGNRKQALIACAATALFLCAGCEDLLPLPSFNETGGGGHGGDPVASGGGGTSTLTGSGGAGAGGSGSAGFFDDLAALSDEFDYANNTQAATLISAGWSVTTLDPNESYPVAPSEEVKMSVWGDELIAGTVGKFDWWGGAKGFLMYKEIEGNFYVETDALVFEPGDVNGTLVPLAPSAGAGLLVRDPAGKPFAEGMQTWMSVDRSTKDGGATFQSLTAYGDDGASDSLFSPPTTSHGRIAICRWNGAYFMYYDDAGWKGVPLPAGAPVAKLNGNVQVGLFVYVYDDGGAETGVKGQFDYMRFRRPQTEADCKN